MTHKLPHKTDIGFWNRYPTAEGCMKMHTFSELVITSSKTHVEGPFLPLQGGGLVVIPKARQRAFKVPCRPITAHSRKGGGLFGDRPSEAELKQKNGLVRRCFRTGAFPLRQNYTKNTPKSFGALCLARSFFGVFPQKRRAGGNTLLPPSAPLLPHINVYMKPIEK